MSRWPPWALLGALTTLGAASGAEPGALAGQVPGGDVPPVAAAGQLAPPAPEPDPTPFGLDWDSEEPLTIRSDELEANARDGGRHLLFKGRVRVVQGGMTLESDRLEADYPPGSSQPDRLVAEGAVHIRKGDRTARCRRAVYDRVGERFSCHGEAEYHEGRNHLEGEAIEIDLAADRIRVVGGASVLLEPRPLARAEAETPGP